MVAIADLPNLTDSELDKLFYVERTAGRAYMSLGAAAGSEIAQRKQSWAYGMVNTVFGSLMSGGGGFPLYDAYVAGLGVDATFVGAAAAAGSKVGTAAGTAVNAAVSSAWDVASAGVSSAVSSAIDAATGGQSGGGTSGGSKGVGGGVLLVFVVLAVLLGGGG